MGKRDTKASKAKRAERRGQGAYKTEQKTAKAQSKQARRDANRKDDEDLGAIIKEFERMDSAAGKVEESVVPPPSPRVNGSLTAHPSRDELLYFGGEVFDGKTTRFFNELYRCTSALPLHASTRTSMDLYPVSPPVRYSIKRGEWRRVRPPKSPPPRSSHQAAAVPADGGSLFIFGGEFSSANGLQARASSPPPTTIRAAG